MQRPQISLLPDGRRLHLQHGPIDLIVGADGGTDAVRAAFGRAVDRFVTILDELCAELPLLRSAVTAHGLVPDGAVPRRMYAATEALWATTFPTCHGRARPGHFDPIRSGSAAVVASVGDDGRCGSNRGGRVKPGYDSVGRPEDSFITPMAAVAGAVAEAVLAAMAGSAGLLRMTDGDVLQQRDELTRAYVNNGGDIALYLAPGESFRIGLIDRPDRPSVLGTTEIRAEDGIAGIATSGWRGRSFSLGIADAVTVLAATAPQADAAATIIANAVDLPGHPAIRRERASDIQPDNDLRDRLVTRDVGALDDHEIDIALAGGIARAETLIASGHIRAAALHCAGVTRVVGWPRHIVAPVHGPKSRHIREVEHAHG
jgi:ApbE superfamily uncharacterized protein (UPF0280 family)